MAGNRLRLARGERGRLARAARARDDGEQGEQRADVGEPGAAVLDPALGESVEHQRSEDGGERRRRFRIKARIDGGGLAHELREERHGHADEDDGRDEDEQQHAEQHEERAARVAVVHRRLRQAVRADEEQREPREHDDAIDDGEREADARACERMDGEVA